MTTAQEVEQYADKFGDSYPATVVYLRQYATILRQTTEGTDALVESHYADDGSGFIGEFVPAEVCRAYERLWKTSVAQTREEEK